MSRQSGQQRPIPQWQDVTLAQLMLLLSLSKAPENNLIPPITRIKLVVVHHELKKANEVLSSTCRQILLYLRLNTLPPLFSLRTFSKRPTSCAPFLGVRSLCINGHRALVNGDMEQVRSNELNSLSLICTNEALVPPFLDVMGLLFFMLGTTLKDS